jgi:hypothetical protein
MAIDDAAAALVAAMAEASRRLSAREWELRREFATIVHSSSSVRATYSKREDAPDFIRDDPRAHFGPGIDVFLTIRLKDGSELVWFGWAINRLDGAGWRFEREVSLDVPPEGPPEVNRVALSELDDLTIPDSLTFARMFPALVDELMALPMPERPPT